MTYDEAENEYVFASGVRLYANLGIIGIDPKLDISGGYDQGISWPPYDPEYDKLTADDMRELADEMLARWQRFKDSL